MPPIHHLLHSQLLGEMVLVRNFAIIGTIMTAYTGLLLELLKVPSLRITCFFCYSNAHSKPMQACSKIGSVHKKNEDIFDAAIVAPPHTLRVTGNKSFHHKYGEKKYGTCWSIFWGFRFAANPKARSCTFTRLLHCNIMLVKKGRLYCFFARPF